MKTYPLVKVQKGAYDNPGEIEVTWGTLYESLVEVWTLTRTSVTTEDHAGAARLRHERSLKYQDR